MIDIILLEPENSGNLGAIARVMKNFGFSRLVLINPKCTIDEVTRCRAKHAQDILDGAQIKDSIDDYDYLIGTTAKIGTDYNLHRSPLRPEEFANKVQTIDSKKVGLLIGREGSGLSNEEIERCDFTVSIPSSTKYPTMNISHAVGILLYELSKNTCSEKVGDQIEMASKTDKDMILKRVDQILEGLEFSTPDKKVTQEKVWKRFVAKAMLTKREAFAVLGFFRKILKI